jgi:hypothetical protein
MDKKIKIKNRSTSDAYYFPLTPELLIFADEKGFCKNKEVIRINLSSLFCSYPGNYNYNDHYSISTSMKTIENMINYIDVKKNEYTDLYEQLSNTRIKLEEEIGKDVIIENRYGKDKSMKLLAVSNLYVYEGIFAPNDLYPGVLFFEILLS